MGLLEHGAHVEYGIARSIAWRDASSPPTTGTLNPPLTGGTKRYDKRARAAAVPLSGGWVKHVYEDAIEFPGLPKKRRGFCFMFAVLMGPLASSLAFIFPDLDLVWILVIGVALYFMFDMLGTLIRVDLFSPEDLPVIFDRKHRKVYRLLQDATFSWKGMFTRYSVVACEYDWNLVDVEYEVSRLSETLGKQVHSLNFLVRRSAADPTIIARFQIARDDALADGKADELWEHIRRFMDKAGPALQDPGEPLACLEQATSWWESMGRVGPFGANSPMRWRSAPILTFLVVAIFPITLPVCLLWGTGHYLSFRTARRVEWPKAVRGRVGWPLEQAPDRSAFSGMGR